MSTVANKVGMSLLALYLISLVVVFFGITFTNSSIFRGEVYELLNSSLSKECNIQQEQKLQGEHLAYVYYYGTVSDVLDWYQETKKESSLGRRIN
jgi:hypothetical protein